MAPGRLAGGRGGRGEQVFLEPEGRNSPELYVQGFSTGLPERLQLALLHTLPGMLGKHWRPPSSAPSPLSDTSSRSCFVCWVF